MDAAERHYAKSAALMAGAGRLLIDPVAWSTDVTIDVALQLLSEARDQRNAGNASYRQSKRAHK